MYMTFGPRIWLEPFAQGYGEELDLIDTEPLEHVKLSGMGTAAPEDSLAHRSRRSFSHIER